MGAGLQRAAAAARETRLTASQIDALKWLRAHNGTGVFNKNGVLLAAGELAPFMRATWNALAKAGLVDIWRPGTRGLTLSEAAALIPGADAGTLKRRIQRNC